MATTATQSKRIAFAFKLRAAIDEQNISVRSLSRRLNPVSPETARSNLMRWLRGAHLPSRTSRRSVAGALGLPGDYFDSDDDEESDPVTDLYNAIRAIVRAEGTRSRNTAAPRPAVQIPTASRC